MEEIKEWKGFIKNILRCFLSKILGLEWHEGEYDGRIFIFDLTFWVKYILMFCLSL